MSKLNEKEIADWAETVEKKKTESRELSLSDLSELECKKIQVRQLRELGYTRPQVATVFGVCERTVERWDKEVKGIMPPLPEAILARDAVRAMIGKAVGVFNRALSSDNEKIATDVASKVLISNDVLRDKQIIESHDFTASESNELVDEAERILATTKASAAVVGDNAGTKEA